MAHIISNQKLSDALMAEGIIPDNCRAVTIAVGAPDTLAVILRYEVYVRDIDLAAFARAFAKAAEAE